MTLKEKFIYIGLGVIGVLQVSNTIINANNSKQIRGLHEKIEPIEVEVKELKKETKNIKNDINVIKGSLYNTDRVLTLSKQEKECLLRNIFFEAGVEDIKGKIAVAQVTWNRVKAKRWGSSVCDVVYAKKQFSWTLEKKKLTKQPQGKLWEESVKAKELFLNGQRVKGVEDSLHYHTDYIKKPVWTKQMPVSVKVGQHIFYQG